MIRRYLTHECSQAVRYYSTHKFPRSVKLAYTVHDLERTGSWEVSSDSRRNPPPLIVLHGLFGNKSNWNSIAKRLIDDGRQIITVDIRNHGDSEQSPDMDYLLMRDDVLRLMDSLHLEQAVLVGHSMGGKVAMALALTQAERLEALVVVDVAPVMSPGGTTLLGYAQRMAQIIPQQKVKLYEARREAETRLRPVVEMSLVRQFLLTNLVEKDNQIYWRLNLDAIINNYSNILDFPEFSEPFTKPTKFIGGTLSHHISSETIPEIQRLFPTADISHVIGAGHWVHSENPPEFTTILRNFLKSLQ